MSQTNGDSQVNGNEQAREQAEAKAQAKAVWGPRSDEMRWTPFDAKYDPNGQAKKVQVGKLAGFRPVEVSWMAEGRLPQGALCVVAGEPGSCKSLLAVEWAARLSNQRGYRDAALFAHAADMPAPTLRARLDKAGATIERIAVATLAWPEPGDDCSLEELERRVMALACGIQFGYDANMIVIDNLEAWAASLDETPSRARIKCLLIRLATIAVKTNTAIVALARLNGPAGGRVAARELAELSAIAPVVWLTVNDAEDPMRRLLLPIKNSLGEMAPAAAFRIREGRVVWEPGAVELSATMIVPPTARRAAERRDREDAAEWLLAALADGTVESTELFRQARSCGISAKTLRRAAKALGLKPRKTAFEGPWAWELGGEVGIRKSEVGGEEERGTGSAESGVGDEPDMETSNASEGGQRCEDGQVRVEKLAAAAPQIEVTGRRTVVRQNEEQERRYLELGEPNERYDFSVIPVSRSCLAKMAK
jgi:putative DNA primase/helicase